MSCLRKNSDTNLLILKCLSENHHGKIFMLNNKVHPSRKAYTPTQHIIIQCISAPSMSQLSWADKIPVFYQPFMPFSEITASQSR